jgi:hypothetical protein
MSLLKFTRRTGLSRLLPLLFVLSPLALPFQIPAGSGGVEPNEGRISDGIYVSKFFGFTYRFPQGLTPQSTEHKVHANDPSRPPAKTFVLFLAATPVKPYKNVAIQAYDAAGFKDGAAYLEKVASSSIKIGLTVLDSAQQKALAGNTFFRQDYYSPQGTFYQTHVCMLSKGYVLDFVISANDHGDIERIFNSLNTLQFAKTGETTLAISQDGGSGMPHWDRGTVEGRTYRNASVGIELTPPAGLEFGAPELKGNPGTVPLLITITAVGEFIPLIARNVMAFYADALAYYPSTRRSTDAYMLRIVGGQQNEGYEPVASAASGKLGAVVFERQDFKKGVVYESVFVKACDAQALVFIFGGADQDAVNKLIAATELKVDSASAGCSSNAPTPNQN